MSGVWIQPIQKILNGLNSNSTHHNQLPIGRALYQLVQISTNLPIQIFSFITFGLSPLPSENSRLSAKPATASDLPFYDFFVPQKFLFRKFLVTSLHVIFGLPPPPSPIKNPGYAYARGMAFRAVSPKSLLELRKRE